MEYKNLLSELDDNQINKLIEYAPEYKDENLNNIKSRFYKNTIEKKKPKRKLVVVAATIAATFLTFTCLVYAGVIDLQKIYNSAFGQSGGEYLSQYGSIIDSGNEYDGIKLNVLSSVKDEDTLLVFFSMTDLTGDRLSDTTDLYDSWNMDQGNGGNCRLIDYDEETKTANFLITSVGASENRNANLTIRHFLKGRESKYDLYEDSLNIYSLSKNNANADTVYFKQYSEFGHGMGISDKSIFNESGVDMDTFKLLSPDKIDIPFKNIVWSKITNIGIVDGMLHIQTKPDDDTFSNIMGLSFVDSDGNKVFTSELSISYGEGVIKEIGHGAYNEFVFENINNIEQIKDLTLVMDVMEYGKFYKGNWKASFKVPEQASKINIPVDEKIKINGKEVNTNEIILSPLGITIRYEGSEETENFQANTNDNAYVTYKNGENVGFEMVTSANFNGDRTISFSYPVIQIEDVISVTINGYELKIK